MYDNKKLNEVETSILENPINNTKIDITSDLSKMVDEVKNIESISNVEEKKDIIVIEDDVPVIELKPEVEETMVVPLEKRDVENISIPTINDDVSKIKSEELINIDKQDNTVINNISREPENNNLTVNEKKKLPFSLPVVLIVFVLCIGLGFVLLSFFKNYESLSNDLIVDNNKNDDNSIIDSVVTVSDDVTASDDATSSDDFNGIFWKDVPVTFSDDSIFNIFGKYRNR